MSSGIDGFGEIWGGFELENYRTLSCWLESSIPLHQGPFPLIIYFHSSLCRVALQIGICTHGCFTPNTSLIFHSHIKYHSFVDIKSSLNIRIFLLSFNDKWIQNVESNKYLRCTEFPLHVSLKMKQVNIKTVCETVPKWNNCGGWSLCWS